MYMCLCVCVCVHTHTHTHTHIYIYIYIFIYRPVYPKFYQSLALYLSAPSSRIFIEIDVGTFFENLSWKFRYNQNSTINAWNLHEAVCSLVMKFRRILIRTRNVSDIICGENETDILYSITCPEIRTVFKIMWIKFLEPK